MPGTIEFPRVVQDAVAQFGDVFANEAERRHFAEYLAGLMVAERKSVLGINREFAQTTDQSCLNKFMAEVDWDVPAQNKLRPAAGRRAVLRVPSVMCLRRTSGGSQGSRRTPASASSPLKKWVLQALWCVFPQDFDARMRLVGPFSTGC